MPRQTRIEPSANKTSARIATLAMACLPAMPDFGALRPVIRRIEKPANTANRRTTAHGLVPSETRLVLLRRGRDRDGRHTSRRQPGPERGRCRPADLRLTHGSRLPPASSRLAVPVLCWAPSLVVSIAGPRQESRSAAAAVSPSRVQISFQSDGSSRRPNLCLLSSSFSLPQTTDRPTKPVART